MHVSRNPSSFLNPQTLSPKKKEVEHQDGRRYYIPYSSVFFLSTDDINNEKKRQEEKTNRYKAWLNFGAFSGLSPGMNSELFAHVVRSHDLDPEETLLYSKVINLLRRRCHCHRRRSFLSLH